MTSETAGTAGTAGTVGTIGTAVPERKGFDADVIGDSIAWVERTLRPNEGWVAAGLLALNLVVVVISVERADWVPSPNLVLLLFIGMLTGLVLYRIPIWSIALLPVGLAVGLAIILWQLSSFTINDVTINGTGEVIERLGLWLDAARTGSISIDSLPFSFALMTATWLTGFLGAWLFLRYSNFWGVFVLGGIGLLSNLTFLPPNTAIHLGFFLFTALLLISRVQAVRRKHEWERRSVKVDDHLTGLSLTDSLALTIMVIVVAFLLPMSPKWGVANDAYEGMRNPLETMEDDFNRLFAGLPARRPMGFRIWDNVMALQGSIYPTTTQVLWVNSPTELYWKARTYSTYNGKGWLSEHTVTEPLGYTPEFTQRGVDRLRTEVTYTVTPLYASKKLFSGDQVLDVDRDVMIETQAPPVFHIDLDILRQGGSLPNYLKDVGDGLLLTLAARGEFVSDQDLALSLPPQFRMDEIEREAGRAVRIRFTEALPAIPEVLSVTSPKGKFKIGEPYEVTSAISLAGPEELRGAGSKYPAWVQERYLQLPPNLPLRVSDLAARVASNIRTPYDKASALENYLRTNYPYNLRVDPPPFNADGVDHFLFTLGEGYSEYFGSTMAVMLRTVGVPARLAVGYTTGDEIGDQDLFSVTDSHSHAWVEVYFPGFGWIPFEPTPGESLPVVYQPGAERPEAVEGNLADLAPFDDECFDGLEDCFNLTLTESNLDFSFGNDEGSSVIGLWPWLVSILAGLAVIGGSVRWLWGRFLAVPNSPRLAFRRMSTLASLASAGPSEFQTPYQFGDSLQEALPAQKTPVSIIVAAYVRNRYGNKYSSASERRVLAVAWQRLRLPMLWAVIRRRVR
jgi:transglutaminase-like putative cysteine protease